MIPMPRPRLRRTRSAALPLVLVPLLALAAACGSSKGGTSDPTGTTVAGMMSQSQMDQLQRVIASAVSTTTAP